MTGRTRSTFVVALRETGLVRISRDQFVQLAESFPRLPTRATPDVIDRLRTASQRRPARSTVTVITLALVSPGAPSDQLARQLGAALGAIAPTLHLDAGHLREEVGVDTAAFLQGADTPRLAAWLDDLELRYRFVVYEAGPEPSAWTRRCLGQADLVILVGSGRPSRLTSELEAELRDVPASVPTELVLLHDGAPAHLRGTGDWLGRWPARMHHHIRAGVEGDMQRLVRHLGGQSIEFVLSGGGARG